MADPVVLPGGPQRAFRGPAARYADVRPLRKLFARCDHGVKEPRMSARVRRTVSRLTPSAFAPAHSPSSKKPGVSALHRRIGDRCADVLRILKSKAVERPKYSIFIDGLERLLHAYRVADRVSVKRWMLRMDQHYRARQQEGAGHHPQGDSQSPGAPATHRWSSSWPGIIRASAKLSALSA